MINFIKSIWPKTYNRIATAIVSVGLLVIAGPTLVEKIIFYFLARQPDLSITNNDLWVGFLLVIIGISYHAFMTIKIDHRSVTDEEKWMVYEVAFLWHGHNIPSIKEHFSKMTEEIKETKEMLHCAINQGSLEASKEHIKGNGITRWVTKSSLIKFCKSRNYNPDFLNK